MTQRVGRSRVELNDVAALERRREDVAEQLVTRLLVDRSRKLSRHRPGEFERHARDTNVIRQCRRRTDRRAGKRRRARDDRAERDRGCRVRQQLHCNRIGLEGVVRVVRRSDAERGASPFRECAINDLREGVDRSSSGQHRRCSVEVDRNLARSDFIGDRDRCLNGLSTIVSAALSDSSHDNTRRVRVGEHSNGDTVRRCRPAYAVDDVRRHGNRRIRGCGLVDRHDERGERRLATHGRSRGCHGGRAGDNRAHLGQPFSIGCLNVHREALARVERRRCTSHE